MAVTCFMPGTVSIHVEIVKDGWRARDGNFDSAFVKVARRHAGNRHPISHVGVNDGTGADNRPGPDTNAWQNACACPHKRAFFHDGAAGKA